MVELQYHTYRVYILRWLLPVLATLALLTVVVWPLMKDMKLRELSINSKTRLRVEEVAMTMPTANTPAKIEVSKPEFIGRDEQNRPYKITAAKVIQTGLQTGVPLTLEKPIARLTLDVDQNVFITLNADSGIYDPAKKTLDLKGAVKVTHSSGYDLDMTDLFVDLVKGWSQSEHGVTGKGPAGTLSGEKLELRDKGNHIILHGKSKITFDAAAAKKDPKTGKDMLKVTE